MYKCFAICSVVECTYMDCCVCVCSYSDSLDAEVADVTHGSLTTPDEDFSDGSLSDRSSPIDV